MKVGDKIKPKQDIVLNSKGDMLRPEFEYSVSEVIEVHNPSNPETPNVHIRINERWQFKRFLDGALFRKVG